MWFVLLYNNFPSARWVFFLDAVVLWQSMGDAGGVFFLYLNGILIDLGEDENSFGYKILWWSKQRMF